MPVPTPLVFGRFKRLPQRQNEVWQGVIRRLPAWIENPEDPSAPPTRPLAALWISLRTGMIHTESAERRDEPIADLALNSILAFGLKWAKVLDGRPSRVEVTDPTLRDALKAPLAELNTSVVLVDQMPQLEAAYLEIEAGMSGGLRFPGLLEQTGVTIARVRAYADAAAEFYRARPWRHLANGDLVVVESPKAPKGLAHICVMGQGGQEFGLSFASSRKAFERLLGAHASAATEVHGVTFGAIDELPFADVDIWESHDLPLAGPRAYPLFCRLRSGGEMTRPSAAELTFAEALLRAFASATEDDLDAGRWNARVQTFDGPMTIAFTLPYLLEALAGSPNRPPRGSSARTGAERVNAALARMLAARPDASLDDLNAALAKAVEAGTTIDNIDETLVGAAAQRTALEEAQSIAYDAMEAQGRLRIALARRALAVSHDCADAWGTLGDAAADPATAQAHYEQAVEAGRRAIGDEFEKLRGEFWSHLKTRPYMRARLSLAQVLEATGRTYDARRHYEDLLQLNPGDNQGIRYLLLPLLLTHGDDAAAGTLLEQFVGDGRAMWPYAALVRVWRRAGESAQARATLELALRENPYVVEYLLEPDSIPDQPDPFITIGGRDDAASVAAALGPAFANTAGLLEWMERHRPRRPRGKRRASRRR